MSKPTQRTIKFLKDKGMDCCIVERWVPMPAHPAGGFRKDMFGFGDLIALDGDSIIAVQSCGQAFSAHHLKITEDEEVAPYALHWIQCGGRLILIGWRKILKKRGGKAKIWSPRIKEYSEGDFNG